jgi:peptidoglycan/xylan/chitin deacetylase (PgdA/CDA1 family)
MYFHKTPAFIATLFPDILWRVKTTNKEIYLTFDDGPVPEATPWVLDELDKFNAKATFFMVGENIEKNPEIFEEVLARGHTAGNHTYNHLKGGETNNTNYFDNIRKAENFLNSKSTNLFRPPHGRLKWSQYKRLKKIYKIIMWDVLSGDFSSVLSAGECLDKSLKASEPGSIIVFHDSIKSIAKLKRVLPKYLDSFASAGFTFKAL